MKQREKRNIVIGLLCVMVVFMSVGYAVLSQNLKINGTANITSIGDSVFNENSNLVRIKIKKSNDEDLELGSSWNGTAEIIYDPNYVG